MFVCFHVLVFERLKPWVDFLRSSVADRGRRKTPHTRPKNNTPYIYHMSIVRIFTSVGGDTLYICSSFVLETL